MIAKTLFLWNKHTKYIKDCQTTKEKFSGILLQMFLKYQEIVYINSLDLRTVKDSMIA